MNDGTAWMESLSLPLLSAHPPPQEGIRTCAPPLRLPICLVYQGGCPIWWIVYLLIEDNLLNTLLSCENMEGRGGCLNPLNPSTILRIVMNLDCHFFSKIYFAASAPLFMVLSLGLNKSEAIVNYVFFNCPKLENW